MQLRILVTAFVLLVAAWPCGSNSRNQTLVVGIILEDMASRTNIPHLPNMSQVELAVDLAFEFVRERYPRFFQNFSLLRRTLVLNGSMSSLLWQVVDWLQHPTQRPTVLLGPMGDFNIANVVRFSAGRYQVPLLTPGGCAMGLRDKQKFPTLTSVMFTFPDLKNVILALLHQFKWLPRAHKNIGVYMVDLLDGNNDADFTMEVVVKTLLDAKYRLEQEEYKQKLQSSTKVLLNHKDSLRELAASARVILICATPEIVRDIMIAAYDLGFHKGNFAFISFDIFTKVHYKRPWYRSGDSASNNDKARSAFRSLLIVRLRPPETRSYKTFSSRLQHISLRKYGYKYSTDENVSSVVVAFHDAVLVYADALSRVIHEGGGLHDGMRITELMKNSSIEGISGNIHINGNGDRNAEYTLYDMNPETFQFQQVAHLFGSEAKYQNISGMKIDWVNAANKPPPDTPKCGFSNKECDFELGMILCLVLISGVTVGSAIAFIIYRSVNGIGCRGPLAFRLVYQLAPSRSLSKLSSDPAL